MPTASMPRRWFALLLLAGAVVLAACSQAPSSTKAAPSSSPSTTAAGPLVAPKTTPAQDAQYFADLGEADARLATYQRNHGNVALKALLTDGAGFCALLNRGESLDDALVGVAQGAASDEATTKLPRSVTTFNTIEAVALIVLCPDEQAKLPSAVRERISKLSKSLGSGSG